MKERFFNIAGVLTVLLVFGLVLAVGGCKGEDEDESNPFIGTWTGTVDGDSVRLVVTANSWLVSFPNNPGGGSVSGTYTYSGNTATFISSPGSSFGGTCTISGNTIIFTGSGGESGTLTRS